MRIVQENVDKLDGYESVSIAYEITSRLRLDILRSCGEVVADPIPPRHKDYDDCPEDRPTALSTRFDTRNWAAFSAWEDDRRVGGTIVARDSPGCDMLEGRKDLAVIFDLRVRPDRRGCGVGKALFEKAVEWATSTGCVELRVETQDVNEPACRFYLAMGCSIHSITKGAYGPDLDEVKLVWRMMLTGS
jgi:GNAT superfamily N-acetyltransferase